MIGDKIVIPVWDTTDLTTILLGIKGIQIHNVHLSRKRSDSVLGIFKGRSEFTFSRSTLVFGPWPFDRGVSKYLEDWGRTDCNVFSSLPLFGCRVSVSHGPDHVESDNPAKHLPSWPALTPLNQPNSRRQVTEGNISNLLSKWGNELLNTWNEK